ncbi:MAG: glycine cleavage system protein GcvH [Propionibacteriaceae bacterium]
MSRFPEDLQYTPEHEWVRGGNGSVVRIGITDFAAEALGDIVYVSLPTVGEEVKTGDTCGELESTKSVSDIFSPVSGVVTAVNEALSDVPETVNTDPYGDGWLFEIELGADNSADDLLDAAAYAAQIGE